MTVGVPVCVDLVPRALLKVRFETSGGQRLTLELVPEVD